MISIYPLIESSQNLLIDTIVCVCMRAKLPQSSSTLCDPMDSSPPGSLPMGFSRQEYWSGLPCSPPGDLPDPGLEPASPVSLALQVDSLPLSQLGSPLIYYFSHFPREVTEAQKGDVTSSASWADEQQSCGGPRLPASCSVHATPVRVLMY